MCGRILALIVFLNSPAVSAVVVTGCNLMTWQSEGHKNKVVSCFASLPDHGLLFTNWEMKLSGVEPHSAGFDNFWSLLGLSAQDLKDYKASVNMSGENGKGVAVSYQGLITVPEPYSSIMITLGAISLLLRRTRTDAVEKNEMVTKCLDTESK